MQGAHQQGQPLDADVVKTKAGFRFGGVFVPIVLGGVSVPAILAAGSTLLGFAAMNVLVAIVVVGFIVCVLEPLVIVIGNHDKQHRRPTLEMDRRGF